MLLPLFVVVAQPPDDLDLVLLVHDDLRVLAQVAVALQLVLVQALDRLGTAVLRRRHLQRDHLQVVLHRGGHPLTVVLRILYYKSETLETY